MVARVRTGVKQGDVTVSLIGPADPADPDDLREHRPLSGFGSIESWQAAIKDLNGALTSSADADPKPILWEHLTTHVWRLPVITEVGL